MSWRFLQSKFVTEYGSVFVLLLLCVYYSFATWEPYYPDTPGAGRKLGIQIVREHGKGVSVVIVVRDTQLDREFAAAVETSLNSAGANLVETLLLQEPHPASARKGLARQEARIDAIATHQTGSSWGPLQKEKLSTISEAVKEAKVHTPRSYKWPSFLTRSNLVNVINQNADIAIIAIGMTLVIITGGIDLSVGSLVALAGVTAAVMTRWMIGDTDSSLFPILISFGAAIGCCALAGVFTGTMVTIFRVPAFVVTLALMEIARGVAYKTAGSPQAVSVRDPAYGWLGGGEVVGIPVPIVSMIAMYIVAHVVMKHTAFGRYVYAVGGNADAARLSGIPVKTILVLVYMISGALAGFGGVLNSSRFESGDPDAGFMYELRVIAAVVVGGTSLSGGEGRVFGTLVGAMIIAVIRNGLNMAGVGRFDQMIVFGVLVLVAVLLDQLKKGRVKMEDVLSPFRSVFQFFR